MRCRHPLGNHIVYKVAISGHALCLHSSQWLLSFRTLSTPHPTRVPLQFERGSTSMVVGLNLSTPMLVLIPSGKRTCWTTVLHPLHTMYFTASSIPVGAALSPRDSMFILLPAATGKHITSISGGSAKDVDIAVEAAQRVVIIFFSCSFSH